MIESRTGDARPRPTSSARSLSHGGPVRTGDKHANLSNSFVLRELIKNTRSNSERRGRSPDQTSNGASTSPVGTSHDLARHTKTRTISWTTIAGRNETGTPGDRSADSQLLLKLLRKELSAYAIRLKIVACRPRACGMFVALATWRGW